LPKKQTNLQKKQKAKISKNFQKTKKNPKTAHGVRTWVKNGKMSN
jgi:hypothetical protein